MLRNNFKDIIFFILVLCVIALLIYLVWFIQTESYQCMSNSAGYTIEKLEKENNSNISCTCISNNKFTQAVFGIDNQGIKSMKGGVTNLPLNESNITFSDRIFK